VAVRLGERRSGDLNNNKEERELLTTFLQIWRSKRKFSGRQAKTRWSSDAMSVDGKSEKKEGSKTRRPAESGFPAGGKPG